MNICSYGFCLSNQYSCRTVLALSPFFHLIIVAIRMNRGINKTRNKADMTISIKRLINIICSSLFSVGDSHPWMQFDKLDATTKTYLTGFTGCFQFPVTSCRFVFVADPPLATDPRHPDPRPPYRSLTLHSLRVQCTG